MRAVRLLGPPGALLTVVLGCASQRLPPPRPAAWQVLESSACGLRFEMPGAPQRESDDRPAPGFARSEGYLLTLGVGYAYSVQCDFEPTSTGGQAQVNDWLAERSWQSPAELMGTRALMLGRCLGRESRIRISRAGRAVDVVIRRYAPADRAVVVVATTADHPTGPEIASRFLESLVIHGCEPAP